MPARKRQPTRRPTTRRAAPRRKAAGSGDRAGGGGADRRPAARRRALPARHDLVAAVDLGSNSFHMVVARVIAGQPHVVDRLRDRVALAGGIDAQKRLTPAIQVRALAALKIFGQRLAPMPPGSVRAVGTNALRQARNTRAFLARAERALGHPIEVVPGREEARLIYVGVSHSLPDEPGRRLVVDIGGGSTECILGERFEPLQTDSLYMGCVTWSRRFFRDGSIKARLLDEATIAARLELQSIERQYKAAGWEHCVGSSGTILAIDAIIRAQGWDDSGLTLRALRKLRKLVLAAGHVRRLALPGLPPDRAEVLPGGLAILLGVFEELGIERMTTSAGSMREGVLYDLLGRIRHEDARERAIRQVAEKSHVDGEQAGRVERTALALLERAAGDWCLDHDEARRLLAWAARVHEIGLTISYSGYHKHSAYIVEYADLAGFSREDQRILAAVVGGHRRKLHPESFAGLPAPLRDVALRLCVLLRLAVRLNRARTPGAVPVPRLACGTNRIDLVFARGWLARHPLTRADLAEERELLRSAGLRLEVR